MNDFWEKTLPTGYYDNILTKGLKKNRGIQANWHNLTFLAVKESLNGCSNHLDYACGPGTFIGKYFSNTSKGVDISQKQIDYAAKHYGNLGDFEIINKLNPINEKYNVISVIGLIEFLEDEEIVSLIRDLISLLNKNGKIILTTPNYSIFMKLLERILNIAGPVNYKYQHINRLNDKKLIELLKKCEIDKFNIKKIVNVGVFFSFISIGFGQKINDLLNQIFRFKFGFIFLIEIEN